MTRYDLIDLIENAIDNVHDLDVTHRDYAEAAADAVLAALPGMQVWRDIASAPRDGGGILLYAPSDQPDVCVCWWSWEIESGGWLFGDQLHDVFEGPTHWMPLPPAPKGDSYE